MRNILLFFPGFPLIGPDGPPDLVEHLHGDGAGGVTQVVQDGGSGELGDPLEILRLQVIGGVQAAPPQEGVLDAGGEDASETHLQIQSVQFLQQTVPRVIPQVGQIVPVDLIHRLLCVIHELCADLNAVRVAVPPLQRRRHILVVFLPKLPQVGHFCAPDRPGVRHVKDVFQPCLAALILANERDALGAGLDPPAHPLIPQFKAGAGCGVGALGINQELVVKGIFVETRTRVQIVHPTARVACDPVRGHVGQLGYSL